MKGFFAETSVLVIICFPFYVITAKWNSVRLLSGLSHSRLTQNQKYILICISMCFTWVYLPQNIKKTPKSNLKRESRVGDFLSIRNLSSIQWTKPLMYFIPTSPPYINCMHQLIFSCRLPFLNKMRLVHSCLVYYLWLWRSKCAFVWLSSLSTWAIYIIWKICRSLSIYLF